MLIEYVPVLFDFLFIDGSYTVPILNEDA
jgi:hypothetical protein